MDIVRVLIVFGVIFIGELPDKSMFASLVLGQRYRRTYVWMGVAAAFLVHVIIAVTAGGFLNLLPHRVVETIVALLFFGGALLLFFGNHGKGESHTDPKIIEAERNAHSFGKVFGTSFVVVFLGEWGDITQIATANYTAKYHDPVSVAIGATLGLWAVAALALVFGAKLLDRIPTKIVQRITAGILFIFAVLSVISAVKG
ncbi:MAG TPA: TMEM165/GDT1 family protein [Patescibacteria group bacterium]|nr:TMEM165/GDT1 family protein [Patescibacteria group bacterium]